MTGLLERIGPRALLPERSASRAGRRRGLWFVAVMVTLMWVLEIADSFAGGRLDRYGIEPRDADGLVGVVAAPFLHAGFGHLVANTIPFLLLGFVIALGGALRVLAVTVIVALVSGLGTWLISPESTNHIGASGVVFGYTTYLISRGIFNRGFVEIAIGVVVGLVWGGVLLAGLVPQEGISWQGHLFGAIGGVAAARLLARRRDVDREPDG